MLVPRWSRSNKLLSASLDSSRWGRAVIQTRTEHSASCMRSTCILTTGAVVPQITCWTAGWPSCQGTLWALGSNDRARWFYERQGWKLDGATKDDDRGEVVLFELRYRRRWLGP